MVGWVSDIACKNNIYFWRKHFNMKKLLPLLFTLMTLSTFAQENVDTLTIDFEKIFEVDTSISSTELYSRAREWFANNFKSANNVLQMDDKESGKLIGHGSIKVTYKALGMVYDGGYVDFTASIFVRAGRYKVVLKDFIHNPASQVPSQGNLNGMHYKGGISLKQWRSIKQQAYSHREGMIASIIKTMSSSDKKSDW